MNETLADLVAVEGYEGVIRALAKLAAADAEEYPELAKVYGALAAAANVARKAEAA